MTCHSQSIYVCNHTWDRDTDICMCYFCNSMKLIILFPFKPRSLMGPLTVGITRGTWAPLGSEFFSTHLLYRWVETTKYRGENRSVRFLGCPGPNRSVRGGLLRTDPDRKIQWTDRFGVGSVFLKLPST